MFVCLWSQNTPPRVRQPEPSSFFQDNSHVWLYSRCEPNNIAPMPRLLTFLLSAAIVALVSISVYPQAPTRIDRQKAVEIQNETVAQMLREADVAAPSYPERCRDTRM